MCTGGRFKEMIVVAISRIKVVHLHRGHGGHREVGPESTKTHPTTLLRLFGPVRNYGGPVFFRHYGSFLMTCNAPISSSSLSSKFRGFLTKVVFRFIFVFVPTFFFGSKLKPSCNFRHRVLKLNEEEEEEEESNKR